jgi:hypothetical protein
MTDDWGVDSHTLDVHWHQPVRMKWYVQPHVRYYTQSAAEFWRPYLLAGDPLPDRRRRTTGWRAGRSQPGIQGGRYFGNGAHEWSARVEYYRQSGGPLRAPRSVRWKDSTSSRRSTR